MTSTFTLITVTDVEAELLFDLSLDIDAHMTSMARSGERAIAGTTTGRIGPGETVTWHARHFGVWFTLTSKITSWDKATRFVDEQVRGPFRVFHHEHRFERLPSGRTAMTDTITLASPVFGVIAERLVLVPYLRRLIAARNQHLLAAAA
ncbi:SRPBCC family protein [Microbacterium sp. cx-59]|uniref:SRPBCC family protein n=1 Tax=Microbacterium sp. cx-59 TaxID=2891207 RepID=UPI001E4577B4|nr:SRPBCC family protein [Microbacterium sp. cx-59]MCC4907397.1 SRPBCC family protein [Microbacterium sp. cx-59]